MAEETRPNTDTQNTDDATMRKISEGFGDMEYEYDLLPFLDSIARAGFDASRMQVGTPGEDVTSYQPLGDVVTIMPSHLADKGAQAHEYRHRGLEILMQELSFDSLEFQKKYGKKLFLQLNDLKDTIRSQSKSRMTEAGNYNQYLHEMLAELYEKPEPYNVGAGYGAADAPPFSYNREAGRATTPAEYLALLRNYSEETGNPVQKYVYPPVSVQEQMDELETDNQAAFREYLDTDPADRVEKVFFRAPFEEGVRKQDQPLFETIDTLSKFAEDANKKRGKRNPEDYFQVKEFAQGGPVMRGIGTLNETARNMTRGPRGIGAYQQFAIGGQVRGDQFNSQGFGEPLNMPYGPAQQLAYQQPQFGIGGMQQGNGINQYGQYLEQTYGDPEFDQKRDTFLQDVQQQEQQTFGGMGGGQYFGKAMVANPPQDYGFLGSINPLDLYKREQEQRESMKVAQIAQYEDMGSLANTGPALSLFASGGEAMGPPPTRGPDPQGIGYFQKFADGGPVYMQEGGEVITPDDIAGMREKIMNDYGFDPEDVAVQEGVPPELFLRLLFKENRGRQGPKSPKGAIGLAQLMPATAEELGVDPTVPYENAVGGARYLKEKIAEFDGDVLLGLAAYNAGAGNVRKYKGVPPFAETEDYVAVILGEGYSGGTSISETIRKEQGFAPSMSYEGQENDVREEQGLVPISMASSGTAEGVGSLMRQESSAPETSLRPVLRPTEESSAPETSLRPVLRSEESSAPETSLRPVLRGQKQTLREKYAPENFERNLLSPDAFQYFNGVSVMERDGKKQGIETLDPRGIRRINNFAMERSTMA